MQAINTHISMIVSSKELHVVNVIPYARDAQAQKQAIVLNVLMISIFNLGFAVKAISMPAKVYVMNVMKAVLSVLAKKPLNAHNVLIVKSYKTEGVSLA